MSANKTELNKLFFDMDGVLARFYPNGHNLVTEEEVRLIEEKGYYLNLAPYGMVRTINELAKRYPEQIYILSQCIHTEHCVVEKMKWVRKYLPGVKKENVLLVSANSDKLSRVSLTKLPISEKTVLIDDHTPNLLAWQKAGGRAVKFINEFNHGGGKWRGRAIDYRTIELEAWADLLRI